MSVNNMERIIPPPPPPCLRKRNCPICGSAQSKLLFKQEFAKVEGVSFLNGYEVVSCEHCGFVYASNIPEQSAFDDYYINANKYEHEIEQPDMITGKYEHIVQEIIHFCDDKSVPVVDVGCARSEILRSLKSIGFLDLTGIDPSFKNIEYLKNKGIKGIHGTMGTIDVSRQFKIVLFLDVLEHIEDINATVGILQSVTALNGMLIIQVPNIIEPRSGELPYQEFSREHINYFTPASLSNLMLQHGFQNVLYKRNSGELTGCFRKALKNIRQDDDGKMSIVNYINQSNKYEHEICANILPYSDTPIIIWGLGTYTQRLLAKNILRSVVALVDSNPNYKGKKYNAIDIVSPIELKKYKEPILISTSSRYIDAIMHTIRNELKLENKIIRLHQDYGFCY